MQNLGRNPSVSVAVVTSSALVLLTFLSLATSQSLTKNTSATTPHIHVRKNLQVAHSACQGTLYPELCVSTIANIPDLHTKSIPQIISATVNVTVSEIRRSAANCTRIRRRAPRVRPLEKRALHDCLELLSYTLADLGTVLSGLENFPSNRYADLQTLLSAAMTNQYTCLDGFANGKKNVRRFITKGLDQISQHVSNALSMLKKIKKKNPKPGSSTPDDELLPEHGTMKDGFPKWLSRRDRSLLQAPVDESKVDLIVAKDGSGDFTTINEALRAAPDSSTTRFVVYIKAGSYYEYVEVEKKKTMIMFLGDGMGQTRIKGNRNIVDGWTTYRSATVAVAGKGFLAKGITIENYAGPEKHQAVALRTDSDLSAFYKCSFVGYQDTLYVHSLRQFYRDCDIYGTVDFIFGNAAVVFQNCNLYARKPMENQKNVFTAQGRVDPEQNTGISILNCKVAAAADLIPVESSFKSYLGRPWKKYSRTVFMLSNIGSLIDPAGWLEWQGDFALETLYYGEYQNRGPGSNKYGRVTWPGYRVIKSSTEASRFTAGNFIHGTDWLPATQLPFYLGLTDDESS